MGGLKAGYAQAPQYLTANVVSALNNLFFLYMYNYH
jgi:hypothetical protein